METQSIISIRFSLLAK